MGAIPTWIAMHPDLWTDEFAFSVNLAKPTFKATGYRIQPPMRTPTPKWQALDGHRQTAPAGDRGTHDPRSISRRRKPIAGMCLRPKPRLTLATSLWTRPRMRSKNVRNFSVHC